MQIFLQTGIANSGSYITDFTPPYVAAMSPCFSQHSPKFPTLSSSNSLTAILISHFLMNLQESNLRSVKVASDDPAYISYHSANTLPSFVAAPGAVRAPVESSSEHMQHGHLENRDASGDVPREEDMGSVERLSLGV